MTISPGTQLGRYEIRSQLGAGGMGEVYLAEDTRLERKVALKILPATFAQDAERMRRFVQEAKAASALNHPNILTIYEIGESEQTNYIAAEYVAGETLRERLRREPLKLKEALDVAAQIASALQAAHGAGIVHRDIKPDNVMIRPDGLAKLLDFGIAKLTEKKTEPLDAEAATAIKAGTSPGMIIGTAAYMSPEQARGREVDARTDIFSFGLVLYEMLSGRAAFEGENAMDIIGLILQKEPVPLIQLIPDVPREIERIVNKALRKDCEERYQTAKDLLIDLKDAKQDLEFQNKLERIAAPNREESKTQIKSATTADVAHTTSSAEYVAQEVKKHKFVSLGIVAALVVALGIGGYFFFFAKHAASFDSIAVLPFQNASGDKETEFLSDGISETLINNFTKIPTLRVIARSTAFRYRGHDDEPKVIGKELGVGAILTGKVLQRGDALSVQVDLINADDGAEIWGNNYNGKASEILDIQQNIARDVSERLKLKLSGAQEQQIAKNYTENAEAYRLYLQGRYYLNEFSEENLNRAIPFFDQAIALDPRYALAYAARGESFFDMGDLSLPMSEAMPKAKQDIAAALSIDDKLVEARTIQAAIKFQYDWDFAGAEEDFKRGIALNPNYAEAHHQYAYYLGMMGRPMVGVAEMKLAQQLDPVNPSINVDLSLPYYIARQSDQSIAQSRKALEMFPNFFLAHLALGTALVQKGDYTAGIEELEKAKTMEPTPLVIGTLGWSYAKSGRKDEARKLLAALKELSKQRYVSSYWIAMIYVGLDEKDEAFAWLEKAYQERSWWLMWIKMESMVDSLRSDSRFTDLTRRIGFPQ